MGAITAYAGLMAKRTGYKALYLSGGGVAAGSCGIPDLGITTLEDVLIDTRRGFRDIEVLDGGIASQRRRGLGQTKVGHQLAEHGV